MKHLPSIVFTLSVTAIIGFICWAIYDYQTQRINKFESLPIHNMKCVCEPTDPPKAL